MRVGVCQNEHTDCVCVYRSKFENHTSRLLLAYITYGTLKISYCFRFWFIHEMSLRFRYDNNNNNVLPHRRRRRPSLLPTRKKHCKKVKVHGFCFL